MTSNNTNLLEDMVLSEKKERKYFKLKQNPTRFSAD